MEKKKLFETLYNLLSKHLHVLPDKSEENPHNTLKALWHAASGHRVSHVKAENLELPALLPTQVQILEKFVQTRLAGVPLAHITERQNFMNLDYILKKGLYIPRKDTELLAKTAISTIITDFKEEQNVTVIDLCTGVGTVALAIALFCKNTSVFGSDIYEPAIETANINAKHFSIEEKATFYNADMFEPFESGDHKGKTQVIVSAPPYISSGKVKNMAEEISKHEPREAFDAGPFGLSIFNKLISTAPEYLESDGYLIFECGQGQGEFLAGRIRVNENYTEITEVRDEKNEIRVLKARRA
jgi:release factor glutamine methyltransferase